MIMANQSLQTEGSTTKFQVTIHFDLDEQFMTLVPAHRTYINFLINRGVIDSYTVSLQSQRSWIVMNAPSRAQVEDYLRKSPLYKYWTYDIDELFVYDGQQYRLPALQLN